MSEMRPSYQQTEVGVIPEDWEVVSLRDVSVVSSGTTPPRSQHDRYYKNGIYPWVKTGDLNNGIITRTDETVSENALRETSLKLYPSRTVLVAMYGGFAQIGRNGLVSFPAVVNQAISAVQCERLALHPEFLLSYLNYRIGFWKSVASSSRKDPNITGNDVRNFRLPIPPPPEQQTIAEALGDADALIDGLEALIAKKRDMKQGAMHELLTGGRRLTGFRGTWGKQKLGSAVVIRNEKVQTRNNPAAQRCIELDQISTATGQIDRLADATGRYAIKYRFQPGDVLFGRLRPYLRKYWLANVEGVCSTEIWPLVPLGGLLDQGFLFFSVQTEAFIVAASAAYGTHMPRADWKMIADYELVLPPTLEEQRAIAAVLSDMDAEIVALEDKLAKVRAVKQGMMQVLLTGEIRLK